MSTTSGVPNVLVFDDNKSAVEEPIADLGFFGCQVSFVQTVEQLEDSLRHRKWDLISLDQRALDNEFLGSDTLYRLRHRCV